MPCILLHKCSNYSFLKLILMNGGKILIIALWQNWISSNLEYITLPIEFILTRCPILTWIAHTFVPFHLTMHPRHPSWTYTAIQVDHINTLRLWGMTWRTAAFINVIFTMDTYNRMYPFQHNTMTYSIICSHLWHQWLELIGNCLATLADAGFIKYISAPTKQWTHPSFGTTLLKQLGFQNTSIYWVILTI